MSNAKGGRKAERRAADMTIAPTADGPPWNPPEGATSETTDIWPVDTGVDGVDGHFVVRLERHERTGQLVGFAVCLQVQRECDDGYIDVIRVDTEHGVVHIDQYGKDGKYRKVSPAFPLADQTDLESCRQKAEDLVWAQVERIGEWLR